MGVVGGFPLGMAISMAATYVGGGKSTSREQDMSFLSNFFFVWCFVLKLRCDLSAGTEALVWRRHYVAQSTFSHSLDIT